MEVIDVDGFMTKDLALAIHGKDGMRREHWVVTDAYMDAVKVRWLGIVFVCQRADDTLSQVKLDKLLLAAAQEKTASHL